LTRAAWYCINIIAIKSRLLPSNRLKVGLLRAFGARVGTGVVIKPGVNIKYPWNISIGNFAWIGEDAWLDSLGTIEIGEHVCISQGAYLCTGNHDWRSCGFDLIVLPIVVEEGVWIGAKAIVLPGVKVRKYSVVTAGSVLTRDSREKWIHRGNPARPEKPRWPEEPSEFAGQ
jgi:putative colanic acid biosynthesis acetyltransferase WcaF